MKRILCVFALLFSSSAALADGTSVFNFRFSPIGLVIGSINVNLDIAVAPNWTVGPELRYWRFNLKADDDFDSRYDITAFGGGVRANWFKNGNYTSGLYVGPALSYAHLKLDTRDRNGSVSGKVDAVVASALVGYGWYWSSFNMMLGGGLTAGVGDNKVTLTKSDGTQKKVGNGLVGPAFEYSLGWTF